MGKFTQYKVQLASMTDGHHEQDFECDTEFFKNMEDAEVLGADIKVHLDVEKKHGAYDCTFTLRGVMQVPCHRCLDPLDHEVDTQYHITVKYGDSYNDESDDVLVIPYSDTYLNVAYMLHDTIMLTLPLRCVHAPGKCNRAMASVLNRHNAEYEDGSEDIEDLSDETTEDDRQV
ncbi:MAG: DUF177 domain-containing protein [Muribaculum sp.]|nr:DUF177 domain-containing protein [Muribaculum sp.]